MRILVCGTRDFDPRFDREAASAIQSVLNAHPRQAVVIHGACRGVDRYASDHQFRRGGTAEAFPADWTKHGRAAGPIRNQRMLDEGKPDLVLAFHHDPNLGRGTADMVRRARAAGVPVEVHLLPRSQ